jgi:hypothetical protein
MAGLLKKALALTLIAVGLYLCLAYQFMIEVFSGHGNSEEHRDWRAVDIAADGSISCPEPRQDYLPSCWQAGNIIESRCLEAGESPAECGRRADRARQLYAENGVAGHNTVGGLPFEQWLDAGQCRDCLLPAFNMRPGGSAQYALSVTNFDDPAQPERFNFALMGSSDNHVARPGTGYKEYDRYGSTETSGVQEDFARKLAYPTSEYSDQPREDDFMSLPPVKKFEHERSSSFFYTGGLIAVHSTGGGPRFTVECHAGQAGVRYLRGTHPAVVRPGQQRPGHRPVKRLPGLGRGACLLLPHIPEPWATGWKQVSGTWQP